MIAIKKLTLNEIGPAGLTQQMVQKALKARVFNEKLLDESDKGNVVAIRELLVNELVDVNVTNSHGDTPLILATNTGHIEAVKELLKKEGINVYLTNLNGYSALGVAAAKRYKEIAELILIHIDPTRSIQIKDFSQPTSHA